MTQKQALAEAARRNASATGKHNLWVVVARGEGCAVISYAEARKACLAAAAEALRA